MLFHSELAGVLPHASALSRHLQEEQEQAAGLPRGEKRLCPDPRST